MIATRRGFIQKFIVIVMCFCMFMEFLHRSTFLAVSWRECDCLVSSARRTWIGGGGSVSPTAE